MTKNTVNVLHATGRMTSVLQNVPITGPAQRTGNVTAEQMVGEEISAIYQVVLVPRGLIQGWGAPDMGLVHRTLGKLEHVNVTLAGIRLDVTLPYVRTTAQTMEYATLTEPYLSACAMKVI